MNLGVKSPKLRKRRNIENQTFVSVVPLMEEEEEEEILKGLLQWATGLGVTDSPLSLHHQKKDSCLGFSLAVSHFPQAGGRGLGAVRDLRKGELLLRVPGSALITSESLLKNDQALSTAVRFHPCLCPDQVLCICLLYEMGKGRSSEWYPYVMSLPRSYTLLASFSEFEKHALQVDDAIWTAEKAGSKAKLQWREVIPLMEDLGLQRRYRSFRAWIWASSTISSRTMHIPWDEAGCLCPVADLFNYAAPGEESKVFEEHQSTCLVDGSRSVDGDSCTSVVDQTDVFSQSLTDARFEEENGSYCFYAKRNYRTGEQVLLSYGTYTNLELLEHYGFLLDENPNEKVFIPLEPSMCTSNSWPKDSMFIHPNGKPSFALSSMLRLWATPPAQRRSVGHLAYSGSQLSVDNEVSVTKWILKKCRAISSALPTTLEEDTRLLSTIHKMQSTRNIVEIEKAMREYGGETSSFFEAYLKGQTRDETIISAETRSAMERWKLAVRWRCRYKRILNDCISICTETISSLQTNSK